MKKSISCVFVVIIALLYYSVHMVPNIVDSWAQNNTGLQTTTTFTQPPTTLTPGVKITVRYITGGNTAEDVNTIFSRRDCFVNAAGCD
jgi:hypothetical protein